jgi:polyhydroxyalkanoate synthesis repressor PhaR
VHLIKKYANRKMYDTKDKRYISKKALAELIRDGAAVQIIDHPTGKDITAEVVSQLLGDEGGAAHRKVPANVLMEFLRKGSEAFSDFARRNAHLWQNAVHMAEDEVDRLVGRMVRNRELTRKEGARLKQQILSHSENLRRWVGERVDKGFAEVQTKMNLATREEVEKLNKKLKAMEKKLAAFEKAQGSKKQAP